MESEISFEDLGLDEQTLAAVARKGFQTPSPIQVLAIPRLLNGDTNLIAKARTGTGKTAAFGLPIVQTLHEQSDHVRALILEPTRELAVQTCTEMQSFANGKFPRTVVVYGGASMGEQIRDLRRGADIVVGTPGRIQDHLERGTLDISKIDYFILDEGDEMLDMGFIEDIEAIFAQANPQSRILLFSATIPAPILKIAQKFMGEYEIVEEEGVTEEPLLIDQKYWVVRENEKVEALVRLIDMSPDFFGLVFTQTKADADLVSQQLDKRGYEVAALHGDIPQGQREKILARFRSKKTRVLVATDVAARGIDITGLSHVVNYSLPFDGSTYVHRIGRTGRAGAAGCAVTFVRPDEKRKLMYLQSAVRKASKGEMTAGTIPSIDTVLGIKRERMFNEMKEAIGLVPAAAETAVDAAAGSAGADSIPAADDEDEIIPLDTPVTEPAEAAAPEDAVPAAAAEADDAAAVPETKLITPQPIFTKMAKELCDGQDPEAVLAAVLSVTYGKALDASHYGEISVINSAGRASNSNQVRLYVQLGRRDGYNARSIADYFSSLLHIPGRMVDRIDVAMNFSLVSLPSSEGTRALDMSKRDSSMPHMHIDIKDEGKGSRRGNRGGSRFRDREHDGFGSEDRFAVGRSRRGGHEGRRESPFGGRSGGFRSSHGRPNVHVPTERAGSAGLYKRKGAAADTF